MTELDRLIQELDIEVPQFQPLTRGQHLMQALPLGLAASADIIGGGQPFATPLVRSILPDREEEYRRELLTTKLQTELARSKIDALKDQLGIESGLEEQEFQRQARPLALRKAQTEVDVAEAEAPFKAEDLQTLIDMRRGNIKEQEMQQMLQTKREEMASKFDDDDPGNQLIAQSIREGKVADVLDLIAARERGDSEVSLEKTKKRILETDPELFTASISSNKDVRDAANERAGYKAVVLHSDATPEWKKALLSTEEVQNKYLSGPGASSVRTDEITKKQRLNTKTDQKNFLEALRVNKKDYLKLRSQGRLTEFINSELASLTPDLKTDEIEAVLIYGAGELNRRKRAKISRINKIKEGEIPVMKGGF